MTDEGLTKAGLIEVQKMITDKFSEMQKWMTENMITKNCCIENQSKCRYEIKTERSMAVKFAYETIRIVIAIFAFFGINVILK